jgi:hypothetical protein
MIQTIVGALVPLILLGAGLGQLIAERRRGTPDARRTAGAWGFIAFGVLSLGVLLFY